MSPLRIRTAADTAMALLDLIRREAPISRVELSHATGLTETSISKTVRRLLESGLIEEAGQDASRRGKSRTMLRLNPSAMHALGIVLDDTRITCIVTDFSGTILGSTTLDGTRDELPGSVIERVAEGVRSMLDDAGLGPADIEGACLASPGRFDPATRSLRLSSAAHEWEGFDAQARFTELTGIPAALEKDYGCAALAEHWVARDTPPDFVTVYLANGIGAGIMIGGELHTGASANAGEIGHVPLDPVGPECRCGNRGCLERIAAPQYLVASAIGDAALAERLGLSGRKDSIRTDFEKLARAAVDGDAGALALMRTAAGHLAQAVLGLVNTLDAEAVVLAGPALEIVGAIFEETLREVLTGRAFMIPVHEVSVRLSDLGLDGAALGAAISVLRSAPMRS